MSCIQFIMIFVSFLQVVYVQVMLLAIVLTQFIYLDRVVIIKDSLSLTLMHRVLLIMKCDH